MTQWTATRDTPVQALEPAFPWRVLGGGRAAAASGNMMTA